MPYSLKLWQKPGSDEIRLYINGTTRQAVYLKPKTGTDGQIVWSSKTNDTPAKYRSGDHYGKMRKDETAADEVMQAFGLEFGKDGEWDRALQIARDGIEIEA